MDVQLQNHIGSTTKPEKAGATLGPHTTNPANKHLYSFVVDTWYTLDHPIATPTSCQDVTRDRLDSFPGSHICMAGDFQLRLRSSLPIVDKHVCLKGREETEDSYSTSQHRSHYVTIGSQIPLPTSRSRPVQLHIQPSSSS